MTALLPQNNRWSMFGSLVRWWHRVLGARADLAELDSCGPDQTERMAKDLGISSAELRQLASYRADESDLLRQRMTKLGLDPEELARSDPATLRDLQRLCTMCTSRGRCARDLKRNAADPHWQAWRENRDWREYCPNAATLNLLNTLNACSEALQGPRSEKS